MRLNNKNKAIVMGNIELQRHCKSIGVDFKKFNKCIIEKMGDKYVFGLHKDNLPVPLSEAMLDNDIATQPDIVLIMWATDDGKIHFEETSKTVRILNI